MLKEIKKVKSGCFYQERKETHTSHTLKDMYDSLERHLHSREKKL